MAGRLPLRQAFPSMAPAAGPLARLQQRGTLIHPLPPTNSLPLSTSMSRYPEPPPLVTAPIQQPLISLDDDASLTQFLQHPEVLRQLDEQERLAAEHTPMAVTNTTAQSIDPLDALADEQLPDAAPTGEDAAGFETEPSSSHAEPPQPAAPLPPPLTIAAPRTPPDKVNTPSRVSTPRFSPPVTSFSITSLQYWGVSAAVATAYQAERVASMYAWQVECLMAKARTDSKEPIYGGNLVYSAPTSSGKSLVADLLVLRTVEQRKMTAIIALPFVAMVAEKYQFLSRVWAPAGISVQAYYKDAVNPPNHEDASIQVAICTFEKANALLNTMLSSETKAQELGIVVIDELHMLADESRGPLLELFITKLRYLPNQPQLVGLSATLPNLHLIASWLDASLYLTDFRPVPLRQYHVLADEVHTPDGKIERRIPLRPSRTRITQEDWPLHFLCKEAFDSHHSVLVFCGTKLSCERTAQQLSQQLPAASPQDLDTRSKLLAALKQAGGVDPMLQETVPKGVAFHHAGLTAEERSVLETGFRSGALRVLTSTSTLAAGVNLPARRVLVREPHFGKKIPLDKGRYNQMCGRAGRTGLDDQGESYLLSSRPQDYTLVKTLSAAPLTPLKSALELQADGLCRCVLEGVSGSGANSHAELMRYLSCTLLAAQSTANIAARLDEALTCLIESGFIAPVTSPTDEIRLTKLGRASVSAAMYPEEALAVFEGLELAKHGLQLHHDLHLTFLVTPVHHQLTPDWGRLLEHLQFLSDTERGVLSVLRIEESVLRALKMDPRHFERHNAPTIERLRYSRFYAAVVLHGLVSEQAHSELIEKWRIARGQLQTLQENAASFAAMASTFARQLSWWHFELLLSAFRDRVALGVQQDMCPLAELLRAVECAPQKMRVLFKAGFATLEQYAEAAPEKLLAALDADAPYRATQAAKVKDSGGDSRLCRLLVRHAKQIVASTPRPVQQTFLPETPRRTPPKSPVLPSPPKLKDGSPHAPVNTATIALPSIVPSLPTACSLPPPCPQSVAPSVPHTAFPSLPSAKPAAPRQAPSAVIISAPSAAFTSMSIPGLNAAPSKGNARILPFSLEAPVAKRKRSAVAASTVLPVGIPFPYTFTTIDENTDIAALSAQLMAAPRVAWALAVGKVDFLPAGQSHVQGAQLLPIEGVALHWSGGQPPSIRTVYWPLTSDSMPRVMALLSTVKRKVAYDTQVQLRLLLERGIELVGDLEDPRIAAWMLECWRCEKGEKLALGSLMTDFVSPEYRPTQPPSLRHAAVATAVESFEVMQVLGPKLLGVDAYRRVEMPLTRVLAEMEVAGIGFNYKDGEQTQSYLQAKVAEVQRQVALSVGMSSVNLASPDQVATLLFGTLQLPTDGLKKTPSGKRFSVDQDTLDHLGATTAHPVVVLIKQNRKLEKLLHSFISPLLRFAHALPDGTHRLHCSILHTATPTGRLTTKDPNLQCLPHDLDVSSNTVQINNVSIRASIVPILGSVLISADYSALELRLVAHFSRDPTLVELMHRKGVDLFRSIARGIYSIAPDAPVEDKYREGAKRIVYGLLYGMSSLSLADSLNCSLLDADRWQQKFFRNFPMVKTWMDDVVRECQRVGYVTTLCGRKRYLPHIHDNGAVGKQAQRQAVNTVCQGSAADLVKLAMIDIGAQLARRRKQGNGARLLMQIHDELLLEVPAAELEGVVSFVRAAMEGAVKGSAELRVPMLVKISAGNSWDSLQEIKPSN